MKTEELAKIAYEAYHKEMGYTELEGWENIPEERYFAWQAATSAIQQKILDEVKSSLDDIVSMSKTVLEDLKTK